MFRTIIFSLLLLFFLAACESTSKPVPPTATVNKWEAITLDFLGPELSEVDDPNPFVDYRLQVIFTNGTQTKSVPGYFAADGNAGETSATSGKVWRVNFASGTPGIWAYEATLLRGDKIAAADNPQGKAVPLTNATGTVEIKDVLVNEGLYAKGRLQYRGDRYFYWAETNQAWLKGGTNSPETWLAYSDFDATYNIDPKKAFVRDWAPHVKDWQTGDPTWQGGKGKGLIGGLNYLANEGVDALYFLSMNIEGDGQSSFPYVSHEDLTRFDCSKLDQWNIAFQHAQRKGIVLHFVTQETENELLLDEGNTDFERRLYYRELIARFGHHPGVIWNLGEENGAASWEPSGQTDQQRMDMASYFHANDPYANPTVIHTHAHKTDKDPILNPLLSFPAIDGISMQIDDKYDVHSTFLKWDRASDSTGHTWVMAMDEIGWYWSGALSDNDDPAHDTLRQEVLWGTLLAGGAGVEWYFGWKSPPNDLDAMDWRSRALLWKQTKVALDFFYEYLPFTEMEPMDELTSSPNAYVFAKPGETYCLYLKKGGTAKLDLSGQSGNYSVGWFDPKVGGDLQSTRIAQVSAGSEVNLGSPPNTKQEDWVVLVRKN